MTAALAHWLAEWRGRARGMLLVGGLAAAGVIAAHLLSAPLTDSKRTVLSPVLFAILLGMLWRHWRGVAWLLGSRATVLARSFGPPPPPQPERGPIDPTWGVLEQRG